MKNNKLLFQGTAFRVTGYAARGNRKTVNIYEAPTTCQMLFQFTDKEAVVQRKQIIS